jgi:HTH-type transcriptional regulator/antitoxin MqsA
VPGKWNGKRCPACGEGILHDGTRTETVDYRGEAFQSHQAGAYCDKCADGVVYNDPEAEKLWSAFRDRVDAEQALELATIRARLDLTQDEASKLSGGGHNAFSRYERREAQPVVGILNLFRLLDRHPSLLSEFLPARGVSTKANAYAVFTIQHVEKVLLTGRPDATKMPGVIFVDTSHALAPALGVDWDRWRPSPLLARTSSVYADYQRTPNIRKVARTHRKAAEE